MRGTRPKLLILSFSDIANDARVMKQTKLFADSYDVTTCGFGNSPDPRVLHIAYAPNVQRLTEQVQALFRRLKWYSMVRDLEPHVKGAKSALSGQSFDAVLVNDPDGVHLAYQIVDEDKVHVDLHEYYPGLHDDSVQWVALRKPYYEWLLKSVSKAGSTTTVSKQIASRYETEYGISCGVVHNSLPFQHYVPGAVGDRVKIVHSGSAQPDRRIEVMMEAVARSSANVSLDLFLTAETGAYAQTLRNLASELGDRVNIHPPKPYSELLQTLNNFDVGIHVLPSTNTNNILALPNKLFDYVQARLGIIVGPTEAMAEPVNRYHLGEVAEGFDVESVVKTIDKLTPEIAQGWKLSSDIAAAELSVDAQLSVWERAIKERFSRG